MIRFDCDYMEGAHPEILKRLMEINLAKHSGYGTDELTEAAKEKIRAACNAPDADVYFLTGGTQTNACVISCLLQSWEGVIAADTAHIACHEAGAIEYTGHKVLALGSSEGKIYAEAIAAFMDIFAGDANNEHEVEPRLVYISQPTEFGTLYSLSELQAIRSVCDKYGLKLYADGARLGYGLASSTADFTLGDMASICDAFYIGGTKVGALFGEAVVMKHNLIPRFFTMIKQRGALLAKGWIAAVQFDVLFTDNLYLEISQNAVRLAEILKNGLGEKGYKPYINSTTNQQFFLVPDSVLKEIDGRIGYSFWEKPDDEHTVIRFVTSWASKEDEVLRLIEAMPEL